jgi:hypothetical protein
MKDNLDNTLEIVLDNGKTEIFFIYFTFVFEHQTYVIYYHPDRPDDVFVKGYDDLTLALSEPSEAALAYAETLMDNYQEPDDTDSDNDGNSDKKLLK